jgi:hypothetical protein
MKLSVSLRFSRSETVGRTPWAGDQLVARPLPVHKHRKTHTQTQTLNIHALSGIRTHDPGCRASEDSACLRPLGYRDRLTLLYFTSIYFALHCFVMLCFTVLHFTFLYGVWSPPLCRYRCFFCTLDHTTIVSWTHPFLGTRWPLKRFQVEIFYLWVNLRCCQ